VSGDRLHIGGQILRPYRPTCSRDCDASDYQTSGALQKRINEYDISSRACRHLDAPMLRLMPCVALRSGGLTRNENM
jgi:hypothetical protein